MVACAEDVVADFVSFPRMGWFFTARLLDCKHRQMFLLVLLQDSWSGCSEQSSPGAVAAACEKYGVLGLGLRSVAEAPC